MEWIGPVVEEWQESKNRNAQNGWMGQAITHLLAQTVPQNLRWCISVRIWNNLGCPTGISRKGQWSNDQAIAHPQAKMVLLKLEIVPIIPAVTELQCLQEFVCLMEMPGRERWANEHAIYGTRWFHRTWDAASKWSSHDGVRASTKHLQREFPAWTGLMIPMMLLDIFGSIWFHRTLDGVNRPCAGRVTASTKG